MRRQAREVGHRAGLAEVRPASQRLTGARSDQPAIPALLGSWFPGRPCQQGESLDGHSLRARSVAARELTSQGIASSPDRLMGTYSPSHRQVARYGSPYRHAIESPPMTETVGRQRQPTTGSRGRRTTVTNSGLARKILALHIDEVRAPLKAACEDEHAETNLVLVALRCYLEIEKLGVVEATRSNRTARLQPTSYLGGRKGSARLDLVALAPTREGQDTPNLLAGMF